jgi:hypothetical protein
VTRAGASDQPAIAHALATIDTLATEALET